VNIEGVFWATNRSRGRGSHKLIMAELGAIRVDDWKAVFKSKTRKGIGGWRK